MAVSSWRAMVNFDNWEGFEKYDILGEKYIVLLDYYNLGRK